MYFGEERASLGREKTVTVQQRRFTAAADARKKPAKCAGAHEPIDDNADAVLLNSYD